jgi:hypothetical protein
MKIAVLTLSLYANYGGNLQAYALLTALKELGHDAWFLNRERHKIPARKAPFVILQRLVQKFILGRKVKLRTGIFDQNERAIIAKYSRQFISKYIQPQTHEFLSTKQLERKLGELRFDAIIVGSDQVWRQRFVKSNLTDYYCGFLPESDHKTKRISYAASFGTSDWEYSAEETQQCAKLLRRFNAVSVREDTGVTQCRERFGVAAEHVIDPTMLLKPERYTALIPDPDKKFSGILVYVLDSDAEKQQIIDAASEHLRQPIFQVNGNAADKKAAAHKRIPPPVEDWLRGFRDAQFVITDSFHGTVFAILFNKPFIALGNPTRGMARFSSLLGMFGLSDRLVTSTAEICGDLFNSPDWSTVNSRLELQRAKAKAFIEHALRNS